MANAAGIKPERLMTYEEAETFVADNAKTARAEEELKKTLDTARVTFKVSINEAALGKLTATTIQEAPNPARSADGSTS